MDAMADRVLDATRSCVLDFGVRRTTLAEVARRAGVSRPTVYRRWPDTRALVADLLTREVAAAVEPARPTGEHWTGRDRIVAEITTQARVIAEHPLVNRIRRTDTDLLATYVLERIGTSQRILLDTVRVAIEAGQRDGSVRDGDSTTLATMILLTAQSVVLSGAIVADYADLTTLLGELTIALDGYLAPRAAMEATTTHRSDATDHAL